MAHTHTSPDHVRAIFLSIESSRVLATRYGITVVTVRNIWNRMTHASLTAGLTRPERPIGPVRARPASVKPLTRLRPDQVRAIFMATGRAAEVAVQYEVSVDTVYSIRGRLAHTRITAELPDVIRSRGRPRKPKPPPAPKPHRPNERITLTDDQIRSIFTSTEAELTEAQRYKVKPGLIRNIRDRSIFAYTTMDLRRPRARAKSTTLPRPELKSNPTPGIDFADLASLHQNLKRPKGAKGTIRFRADYKDAPTIVAYLIPLTS